MRTRPYRNATAARPKNSAVDEHDLLVTHVRGGDVAIHRARQEVRQPVVVERTLLQKRVVRRNVSLGNLRRDGDRPDEVRGEVGAIRFAIADVFAHVRVRRPGDERDDEHRQRHGNDVTASEHREA